MTRIIANRTALLVVAVALAIIIASFAPWRPSTIFQQHVGLGFLIVTGTVSMYGGLKRVESKSVRIERAMVEVSGKVNGRLDEALAEIERLRGHLAELEGGEPDAPSGLI